MRGREGDAQAAAGERRPRWPRSPRSATGGRRRRARGAGGRRSGRQLPARGRRRAARSAPAAAVVPRRGWARAAASGAARSGCACGSRAGRRPPGAGTGRGRSRSWRAAEQRRGAGEASCAIASKSRLHRAAAHAGAQRQRPARPRISARASRPAPRRRFGCRCGLPATIPSGARIAALRVGGEAAGLAHHQQPGRDVPGLEAQLPVAVEAARRHPGEVQRGGRRSGGCRRPAASARERAGERRRRCRGRPRRTGCRWRTPRADISRRAETRSRRSLTKAPTPFSAQNISSAAGA